MSGRPHAASSTRAVINDCWNTIGVRGDGSCPELATHGHCRNCPTYTAAAEELLDGDLPADYVAEWTTHFAQEKRVEDLEMHSVVIFRIGAEWLALPTLVVLEVADLRAIHSLPHRRGGVVLGVANVRGELLVCFSVGHLLGIEQVAEAKREQRHTAHGRLLVVRHEGTRAVVPVDEVHGAHRLHARDLRDVPATVAKAAATYSKATLSWQGKSVGVLDDELLFYTLNRSLA
jgi:chemotaxis-related protein WspD